MGLLTVCPLIGRRQRRWRLRPVIPVDFDIIIGDVAAPAGAGFVKTVVIKYGGNAMISEALRKAVISDIILLRLVGINVVVVHGGGPEINELLKKTGKESRFVNGLRYTDSLGDHGVAAVFDDHGFLVIFLNVGQCLYQHLRPVAVIEVH